MVAERGGLVAEPSETGNGACSSLRYEWVLFSCGSDVSWLRPTDTGQVIQRLQNPATAAVKQLDRALSKDQNEIMLDEVADVEWTGGGYSCSREVGQVDWQQGCMAQLVLRDESLRWGRHAVVSGSDECREQHARADQCAAHRCAVAFRPDHVVHGKRLGSHRKCSTRLEY